MSIIGLRLFDLDGNCDWIDIGGNIRANDTYLLFYFEHPLHEAYRELYWGFSFFPGLLLLFLYIAQYCVALEAVKVIRVGAAAVCFRSLTAFSAGARPLVSLVNVAVS